MAKKQTSSEGIYKIIEVVGTSTKSWEDAASNAVVFAPIFVPAPGETMSITSSAECAP